MSAKTQDEKHIKARKLVIGRANTGRLVICDEETGQPLGGQSGLVIEDSADGWPKVTVTFAMTGSEGVVFMGEDRKDK